MATSINKLAQDNPNIGEQLHDWQVARTQNNEDSYTWSSFRDHAVALGAPDPGEEEPDEFRQYDWTKYTKHDEAASSGSSNAGIGSAANASIGSSGASAGASAPAPQQSHNPFERLQDFLRHR